MEFVRKVEMRLAPLYEKAPHLPVAAKDWLANNIWWLALISVILGVLGVLGIFLTIFVATLIAVGLGGLIGAGVIGAVLGGVALIIALLAMGFSIATIIVTSLAISPLKNKYKKGWLLLLLTLLISVLSLTVTFLFTFEMVSFLFGLFVAVVIGYFLFEIRGHFSEVVVASEVVIKKKPVRKSTKKTDHTPKDTDTQ